MYPPIPRKVLTGFRSPLPRATQVAVTAKKASPTMIIDVYADPVCPWCFVGKRRLDRALGRLPAPVPGLHWRAFQLNPRLVWEWYDYRRRLVVEAKPNPAHEAIARMETLFPEFHLITQNIDGLHQRAGSRKVIELHGNITRTKCFDEDAIISSWKETGDVPPKCPNCGGLLRPDVVWFEELLPQPELEMALHAATTCDVFLSIGTSAVVYPAAALPLEAHRCGATVVVINPQPTPLSDHAHYVLVGAAGVVLPRLMKALRDTGRTGSRKSNPA